MKKCDFCGTSIHNGDTECRNCGAPIYNEDSVYEQPTVIETASIDDTKPKQPQSKSFSWGYAVLGFCIPIVGFILYGVKKDTDNTIAMSALKGACWGMVLFLFW